MKAMVVYDSVHGNTEEVARAVAEGLGRALESLEEVEAHCVSEMGAGDLADLDLLVVGAPTHAFQPAPDAKAFLNRIPSGGLKGVSVAAFDTRFAAEKMDSPVLKFMVRLFGYAAKPIADRLQKRGGDLVLAPEGFIVEGTEGPLREGELERAADWGRRIADRVQAGIVKSLRRPMEPALLLPRPRLDGIHLAGHGAPARRRALENDL